MYIEKRKSGNNIKYYLVYSYRNLENKVKKIRKYLGLNISKEKIKTKEKTAKEDILNELEKNETDVFRFSLTNKQINSLNKYNDKINILQFSEKEWKQFTEEFVYNTNAIEGSKVSENEVHDILQKKKVVDSEEIETKGVARAIDYIRKTREDLSINLILKLHKFCFEGSKDFAGKFRDVEVIIRGRNGSIIHSGTPVKELDKELKSLIGWYKKNMDKFKPIVLAAIIHNQFEDIHPFQDGNGRVGRLLLNFILIKNNYPPINILLKDRSEYYEILQEYQINDRLRPTLRFLINQYEKTLKQVSTKKNN